MQVGIDIMCLHTSFGGRDSFGFGDMATFQKQPKIPFGSMVMEKFNQSESAQIIYASRD